MKAHDFFNRYPFCAFLNPLHLQKKNLILKSLLFCREITYETRIEYCLWGQDINLAFFPNKGLIESVCMTLQLYNIYYINCINGINLDLLLANTVAVFWVFMASCLPSQPFLVQLTTQLYFLIKKQKSYVKHVASCKRIWFFLLKLSMVIGLPQRAMASCNQGDHSDSGETNISQGRTGTWVV